MVAGILRSRQFSVRECGMQSSKKWKPGWQSTRVAIRASLAITSLIQSAASSCLLNLVVGPCCGCFVCVELSHEGQHANGFYFCFGVSLLAFSCTGFHSHARLEETQLYYFYDVRAKLTTTGVFQVSDI